MSPRRAILSLVFVALVVGAALGAIFLPLMAYEQLMRDEKAFWIWVAEWIGLDLALTAFLCRKEIRALVPKKPDG
jgi:hypothetical protein